DLAGVSTRTLRYYDEIGLLSPSETGDNGYRYYNHESLLALQQIMFFRELDMPLKDIQLILSSPEFNLVIALEEHRVTLQAKAKRLKTLIETVDQTITTIQGEWTMKDQDYFEGFNESQYEEEAKQRWGKTPQWAESQKKWASYSKEQKEAIKTEGGEITKRMVGDDPNLSPNDPDVQAAIGDYHVYINKYFYTCDVEFIRNLADMWVEDPRFAANYERIRQGGAAFVREAVHTYCDQNG
ncbi:MAG: MerR family transcriptional regulator, partial [candidate division Zixibacteria bacterium]|nr:MerR family transcriptional regulator [Gammaproteobacteria bacterium]NIX55695.1 MerR family transcriptional regulator [candidate division Zixibacteria bacterium]